MCSVHLPSMQRVVNLKEDSSFFFKNDCLVSFVYGASMCISCTSAFSCVYMTLIIHEMLRKKHNTAERQSNTTQLTHGSYFY